MSSGTAGQLGNSDCAEDRYPHLGRHVRTLAFRHQDARQTRYPLDQAGRPGQRQDIWDLAVGLIGLCPNLEILIWEIGLGVGSGLWKVRAQIDPSM
jgi:hypothetical protein